MEKQRLYAIIFHCNWAILLTVIALNLVNFFFGKGAYWGIDLTVTILLCLLFVIDFFLYKIIKWLIGFFGHKEKCNFSSKDLCPYSSSDDCPYDVRACYVYQEIRPTRKRQYVISFFLFLSIAISIIAELLKEDGTLISFVYDRYSLLTLAKILQPIAQSVIAAIIISLIIDIPERIKEYKSFFVDILTSYDYLKTMDEEKLTNLRKRVTRQLHVKDFPHMAEGLIDLDERFCMMLKQPYFSEYSQIVNVQEFSEDVIKNLEKQEKIENDSSIEAHAADAQSHDKCKLEFKSFFMKSNKTEYVAINPMHTNAAVKMDIGQNSCVRFQGKDSLEEAKKIFKLKKFTIIFDDDKQEYDLTPYVCMAVSTEPMEGLIYNGIVSIRPIDEVNNKDNPFSPAFIKQKEKEQRHKPKAKEAENGISEDVQHKYVPVEKMAQVGLWASFCKKIQVKLEFDIAVPKVDVSYTKRLRYPVKLFNLDYSLGKDVDGYTVVGQMIGTLIDQQDVSTNLSSDHKRITMRTHDWLLPKNGAVVVHCKD